MRMREDRFSGGALFRETGSGTVVTGKRSVYNQGEARDVLTQYISRLLIPLWQPKFSPNLGLSL